MATKKTTTKKTVKKQVTMHKVFDLDVRTQAQANELIAHLEVMRATAGWLILKQIIESNMAVLERAILLKVDPVENKPITEVQADELRYKRNYLEELAEKPERLIAQFKKQTGIEVPTYDPYATDAKQMRSGGAHVGAPMASPLKSE